MEIVEVPPSGKLIVQFAGFDNNNTCEQTNASSCPDFAICYVDAPWSASYKQCACSSYYGRTGATCTDPTSWTVGLYVVMVALIVFAVANVGVGVTDLFTERRSFREWTAAHATVALCVAASVIQIAMGCVTIVSISVDFRVDPLVVIQVPAPIQQAQLALLGVAFFFSTLAAVNVSISWLETADQVERMNPTTLWRYKAAVVVYYIVFLAALVYGLSQVAVGRIVAYAATSFPAWVFVLLSYFVGHYRVRALLLKFTRNGLPDNPTKRIFIKTLNAMSETTLLISLATAVLLGLLATVLAMGGVRCVGASPVAPNKCLLMLLVSLLVQQIIVGVITSYVHTALTARRARLLSKAAATVTAPDKSLAELQQTQRQQPTSTRDLPVQDDARTPGERQIAVGGGAPSSVVLSAT